VIVLPTTCRLCPRACGANRALGERGVCGASDELVVARAALHAWEEPPISGSVGSGTVFFAYCPLRCVYCQNAPIAQGHAGRVITVERLSEICLELEAQGAANINFVTPTHFAPHAREAVRLARARGLSLPIVWNTSGYETVEAVHENAGTVDVYLSDFKYMSADAARRYSHAPDYAQVAFAALDAMVKEVGAPAFDEYRGEVRMTRGVIVRHLILPGGLEDSKAVVRAIHERYGDSVMLSLMNQYTPVLEGQELLHYPELAGRVSGATYEELLDFADSLGIKDYFWQEGGAAAESFIPPFDLTGV
jgi:putative pyruvate formate lyase activating enzyme